MLHFVELWRGRDLRWVATGLSVANNNMCSCGLKKGAKWVFVDCGSDWDDEGSIFFFFFFFLLWLLL